MFPKKNTTKKLFLFFSFYSNINHTISYTVVLSIYPSDCGNTMTMTIKTQLRSSFVLNIFAVKTRPSPVTGGQIGMKGGLFLDYECKFF